MSIVKRIERIKSTKLETKIDSQDELDVKDIEYVKKNV